MLRFVIFAVFFLASTFIAEAGIKETIKRLAPNGLVLVVDESGKTLVSQNANKAFVPASVVKVVTAWLALDELGGEYRFETRFYMDTDRVLYVRGGGDPFLVSEEFALIAPKLLERSGKKAFSAMVLDTDYYPTEMKIPGIKHNDEAYNALNSALAANFNTIHAIRKGNSVRSAEKQTPITPLAISQFKKRGPKGRGRISLAQQDPSLSPKYAGELLAEFIRKLGGEVRGSITIGKVPQNLQPFYVHRQSRPLSEIVSQMLIGSNNYIANQIFLEVGASKLGSPVSINKSLNVLTERLQKHGLTDGIMLVEGSGISRDNRVTASGLVKLLEQFAPHATLMKRTKRGSRYKTGTLDDVSTLAGFARTTKSGFVRFVIALPGRSGRLRFQILRAIEREL
ncbi:MAG: D-alanyl-D-alanine carboxypeptidase [Pseudomonadota bacterium]